MVNTNTPYRELKGIKQVIYAFGHIGPGMLNQFITTWLLLFLTGNAGNIVLSGTLVGVATLCGRVVDAVADPLVANISDNIKGKRFGRRLPFMILGTLPMIFCFLMLWLTPNFDLSWMRFVWLFIFLNGFYLFYNVVVNPYFALLPEIAKDMKQRVFIQSFVSLFGILGMGISLGASGFLIDAFGYMKAGLIVSTICALAMITPALIIKVNPEYELIPSPQQTDKLFVNIAGAFANAKFRKYIISFATFFFGFQLIQYNLAFITTVSLQLEKSMSSLLFIVAVVSALAFIPLYNVFVKKLGTIRSLMISTFSFAIVAIIIAAVSTFSGTISSALRSAFPETGIDFSQLLGILLMALLGFPYSGLMVIPNVLISEIIDDDFERTHVRREAMFFGVQGLINNTVIAIASLTVGVLQDLFGNTRGDSLGVTLISPIAAVFALIGFFVIAKMHAIKKGQPQ